MISIEIEDIRHMARFHLQRYLTGDHPSVIKQLSHMAKMQGVTDVVGINLPKCPEFRAVAVELKNGHQYIMFNSAQPIDIQEHYIVVCQVIPQGFCQTIPHPCVQGLDDAILFSPPWQ